MHAYSRPFTRRALEKPMGCQCWLLLCQRPQPKPDSNKLRAGLLTGLSTGIGPMPSEIMRVSRMGRFSSSRSCLQSHHPVMSVSGEQDEKRQQGRPWRMRYPPSTMFAELAQRLPRDACREPAQLAGSSKCSTPPTDDPNKSNGISESVRDQDRCTSQETDLISFSDSE
jgi:hypothetical protein